MSSLMTSASVERVRNLSGGEMAVARRAACASASSVTKLAAGVWKTSRKASLPAGAVGVVHTAPLLVESRTGACRTGVGAMPAYTTSPVRAWVVERCGWVGLDGSFGPVGALVCGGGISVP